ncbi:MAG: histidinol-phosphatase [Pirellulaceae bacterium]|nr:histidinol-phosphatase [Pirellulaceae bacterium]
MPKELPSHLSAIDQGRFGTAFRLAVAAGQSTLRYFRTSGFQVERKSDKSPVTIADKEAEQLMRRELEVAFPNDAILGEEFGEVGGDSEYRWIVDPIDGTKSFISGVPLYSTLVGVTRNGKPSIGVIYIPGLDEIIVAATGHGAWYAQGESQWIRARVSQQSDLGEGLFVTSQVDTFDRRDARAGFDRVVNAAYVTRTWGDGYGYLLVATGRAEVMVDPIVNPWDVAAVMPVIEEAGGRFTDWDGIATIQTGNGVGSNGHVHEQVLAMLKKGDFR